MKLKDLINCSAPLLAESGGDETYPYWFGGTCFRVRCQGGLYISTAAHCLKDKSKDEVRIQRHPESKNFLKLTALFRQSNEGRHEDDLDRDDWAVLQSAEPALDPADPLGEVLDLNRIDLARLDQVQDQKLVVRGYPKAISSIDYERRSIKWQAFAASGRYLGRPEWSEFCHTMILDDVSQIESIDGLSGSPVFKLVPEGSAFRPSFAGMALRGSKESRLLHFLDARVVQKAVAMAHTNRRE